MTLPTAPAYNTPQNFTGIVTEAYGGTGILLAYRNGEAIRGKKGGLRKFKTREAAEAALAPCFSAPVRPTVNMRQVFSDGDNTHRRPSGWRGL